MFISVRDSRYTNTILQTQSLKLGKQKVSSTGKKNTPKRSKYMHSLTFNSKGHSKAIGEAPKEKENDTVSCLVWQRLIHYPFEVAQLWEVGHAARSFGQTAKRCCVALPWSSPIATCVSWWGPHHAGCDARVWWTWGFPQPFVQMMPCPIEVLIQKAFLEYLLFPHSSMLPWIRAWSLQVKNLNREWRLHYPPFDSTW